MSHQQKAKFVSKKPAKNSVCGLKFKLSNADKDILLHPIAWVNDNIIHAAQLLLKKQVPEIGGFQVLGKGQVRSFDSE